MTALTNVELEQLLGYGPRLDKIETALGKEHPAAQASIVLQRDAADAYADFEQNRSVSWNRVRQTFKDLYAACQTTQNAEHLQDLREMMTALKIEIVISSGGLGDLKDIPQQQFRE